MTKYLLGMDIGGTNVRLAVMNSKRELYKTVQKYKFIKADSVQDEVENNICLPIYNLIESYHINSCELAGLGISLAALFDRNNGAITTWPNNPLWNLFPIKSYLEERLSLPVIMEDDANSAAMGEHLIGAGKGFDNFAYVTISTGVGCGLILNNSLYNGTNGWAGEIGHTNIVKDGPLCSCGARGCLQALVSGPALYKKYIEIVACSEKKKSLLADNFEQVSYLAQEGDETALGIFEYAAQYLSRAFYNMIMMLDLPLIVIGGGVTQTDDILLKLIRRELSQLLEQSRRRVMVENSKLGENSGVIGALNLVYKYSLSLN